MSRRPGSDAQMDMLLRAVNSHPWARAELVHSQSGLRPAEFEAVLREAKRHNLVSRVELRGLGQAPARFALSPAGARLLGIRHPKHWQQMALLAALKLDYARALLNNWFAAHGVIWAVSPYLLPASSVRPGQGHSEALPTVQQLAYRSLRLDGLACLRLAEGEYVNVAVMTDPGNLKLDWFFQQMRSAHAWRRRPEFTRLGSTYFPVLVALTTDRSRLTELAQAWQASAHAGEAPGLLRLALLGDLDRPRWRNERSASTTLWGGVFTHRQPSRRPPAAWAGWWGDAATSEVEANRTAGEAPPTNSANASGFSGATKRALLQAHQAITLSARELLDRVGQFPLMSADDLAVVAACSVRHVYASLRQLRELDLIELAQAGRGYVLGWMGLCLLAAQVGLPPVTYAGLRGWPLRQVPGGAAYAVGWLEAVRDHTRLVVDFLVGLCHYGPPRLWLVRWDHVQCLTALPTRSASGLELAADHLRSVSPDATGLVRVSRRNGGQVELAFWLEVDRSSIHGAALAEKLARYYQLGGAWDGLVGRLPRLLVLVERGGEGRLQALRRRLRALNEAYQSRLDVRLTRADLLADEHGRLNPLRRAWRSVEASEFVSAFDG